MIVGGRGGRRSGLMAPSQLCAEVGHLFGRCDLVPVTLWQLSRTIRDLVAVSSKIVGARHYGPTSGACVKYPLLRTIH
jgi:hypothetical protein